MTRNPIVALPLPMAAAGAVRPEVVADFIVLAGSPLDDIANARRIERIVHRGRPRSPPEVRALW
jgi:imidazolonepropionase-like amidohydrolase